jgi:hypothetical protein
VQEDIIESLNAEIMLEREKNYELEKKLFKSCDELIEETRKHQKEKAELTEEINRIYAAIGKIVIQSMKQID